MSIEQCTIGTDVAAHELLPIISYWPLCIAAIVILYISQAHSWLGTCTDHIIIIMYLDPCVSINCKYKIINKIRLDPLTWCFMPIDRKGIIETHLFPGGCLPFSHTFSRLCMFHPFQELQRSKQTNSTWMGQTVFDFPKSQKIGSVFLVIAMLSELKIYAVELFFF